MATFTKFQSFVEKLAEKTHNLGSDTLKVMLTLTAPSASASNVKADLTEITAGNGYTAGGTAASITSSAQTTGTYKLVLGDVLFTATGAVGPFRYVVLYNDTATNKDLIGFYDYGSSLTLASGDTFNVDFDPSTGVLTIA
jgi:hypothetical protein